jgi:hypothetical protein
VAKNEGKPAPEGTLIDSKGQPTRDPNVMYSEPLGPCSPSAGTRVMRWRWWRSSSPARSRVAHHPARQCADGRRHQQYVRGAGGSRPPGRRGLAPAGDRRLRGVREGLAGGGSRRAGAGAGRSRAPGQGRAPARRHLRGCHHLGRAARRGETLGLPPRRSPPPTSPEVSPTPFRRRRAAARRLYHPRPHPGARRTLLHPPPLRSGRARHQDRAARRRR